MRRPALLTLLLLACCATSGPKIAPTPLSPQEEACATQADQDPALQEARGVASGRLDWLWQHEPEMEQIKRDAVTRCLKSRGLLPRGGVEKAR